MASHPCWRDLTFTMDCICWAKKADPFIEQNLLAHSLPLVRSFLWWEVFIFCFFLESQKMDSDLVTSNLIKCHKIKSSERFFFFNQLDFCCQNLLNEASDSQFSVQNGAALEMLSTGLPHSVQSLKVLPVWAWPGALPLQI